MAAPAPLAVAEIEIGLGDAILHVVHRPDGANFRGSDRVGRMEAFGGVPGAILVWQALAMLNHLDGERIAEERIAEVARTKRDTLDLAGLGLTRLPEPLFALPWLRSLNLGVNMRRYVLGWQWNLFNNPHDRSNCVAADLHRLAELPCLQELCIERSDCTDLKPISRLNALKYLSCDMMQISSLAPVADLTSLKQLTCDGTQVSDLSPIQELGSLQYLSCNETQVGDLTPTAGLHALQYLSCNKTLVNDLTPIAGLHALKHIFFNGTLVSNLAPIVTLNDLQEVRLRGCTLTDVPVEIWRKPTLRTLSLDGTTIPGIPEEVLGFDCLDRLRAHLNELEAGAETVHDAKLLVLGNGRSGKTQIARRLQNLPFDEHWDSTHGIRVTQATLPAQDGVPETTLKLWDFGGQEIYHGTHALFVRSRAIFLLAWSKDTEAPESDPDPHGMVFRNHPLRYWVDYVRHLGRASSPVVIAQTRLDMDGVLTPPLGDIKGLNATTVQASSADPPRLNALRGALQDASAALYRQRGAVTIGKPRIEVQRRIEGMRHADGSMPEAFRLIDKATFEAWYREAGGKAEADYALAYLNDNGTLFYREGLFGDRVVLDHSWAMNAIYAVFDRKSATYARLQGRGGRFERADLSSVWHDRTEAEQRVFLGMMRSCGICFVYRGRAWNPEDDDDTTYLAPELLPERAAIQPQIDATWGTTQATHRQVFTYPFLHEGLIRGIIAHLGELAQTRADYFRGGVCLYDARTQSRALIAQTMAQNAWQGTVTIETKDGQAGLLLARLTELVQQENEKLGLTPAMDPPVRHREVRQTDHSEEPAVQPDNPPTSHPQLAVSYAWNEPDGSGPDREAPVDRLCEAARVRNIVILRDKTSMAPGDSINAFARQIAASPRVFVFLSDDYLKSAYCVRELYELWRECRHDRAEMKARIRLFKLDDVRINTVHARAAYFRYWNQEYEARKALDQEIGLRGDDQIELDFIEMFRRPLMEVLAMFQDTIRHTTIEDFVRDAFNDRPDRA